MPRGWRGELLLAGIQSDHSSVQKLRATTVRGKIDFGVLQDSQAVASSRQLDMQG